MHGGVQYSVKLDGIRCLCFRLEDQVVLQSRTGRDLARDFPDIAAAAAELPAGTVLDGELCAVDDDGRYVFEQLLRSQANRTAHLAFVAVDQVAEPGRDLRPLPFADRWTVAGTSVDTAPGAIQLVLATLDRAEAVIWYESLAPLGVEGIVCKALCSAYRPSEPRSWLKVRHAETVDAQVVDVIGPQSRPLALRVRLPDGRIVTTSPDLNPVQARHIAAALAERAAGERLLVEIRMGTGRHGVARFVRVRTG